MTLEFSVKIYHVGKPKITSREFAIIIKITDNTGSASCMFTLGDTRDNVCSERTFCIFRKKSPCVLIKSHDKINLSTQTKKYSKLFYIFSKLINLFIT